MPRLHRPQAVAIVLGFVGAKLGAEAAGIEVSSAISLAVIFGTLGSGVALSLAADAESKASYSKTPDKNGVFLNLLSTLVSNLKSNRE